MPEHDSPTAARIKDLEKALADREQVMKDATDPNVKERKRREIAALKGQLAEVKKGDK